MPRVSQQRRRKRQDGPRPVRLALFFSLPLCLLLVVLLAVPASAQAAFTFAGTISGSIPEFPGRAVVAVSPNGDAVFAWTSFDGTSENCCRRIQARARSAAGPLSPVQTLTGPGQNVFFADVGIDADGDAVFTWADGGPVRARARSAAGTLSPVQTISQDTPNSPPAIEVAPNGRAIFVWSAGGHIRTRARSPAGSLSVVQTVSGFRSNDFDMEVDSDGDAVFVWTLVRPNADDAIQARARSAAGTLSAVQDLSVGSVGGPEVGVDADGDAVFVWTRFEQTDSRVYARARSRTGVLSAIQPVASLGSALPHVGVDADGDAVFVWQRPCGGLSSYCVLTRARSAAGVLSPVQSVSTPHGNFVFPQLAVDADGNAVYSWDGVDATTQCDGRACLRIHARSRSAAGAMSPIQILSAGGQHATDPEVATNAGGDAIVVWNRRDGTTLCNRPPCGRIQAAVQPAP
jgi:hypothetical protein